MCDHNDKTLLTVCMPSWLSMMNRARLKTVPVDSCIAPLISRLNELGLLTANSCCGHGQGPGIVSFHDGTDLTVEEAKQLASDPHGSTLPVAARPMPATAAFGAARVHGSYHHRGCEYCGGPEAYKGECPQCPPGAMERKLGKGL